jgi:hypothetical protein
MEEHQATILEKRVNWRLDSVIKIANAIAKYVMGDGEDDPLFLFKRDEALSILRGRDMQELIRKLMVYIDEDMTLQSKRMFEGGPIFIWGCQYKGGEMSYGGDIGEAMCKASLRYRGVEVTDEKYEVFEKEWKGGVK